jgi:hypothetical protein
MLTTEAFDVAAVTDYTQAGAGVAGKLNGAKLILGTNDLTPGKKSVVADITQPTYTGYAPVVVTWGVAMRDANGDIVTLSAPVLVQMGDSVLPTTIKCWGLTDGAGTGLLLCEELATPIPLADALAFRNVQIPFAPGNPQGKSLLVTS